MEENVEYWHKVKSEKYGKALSHLQGWKVFYVIMEIGCRGWIPPRFPTLMRKLGFRGKEPRTLSDEVQLLARKCSYVIWLNRFHKEFHHGRITIDGEGLVSPTIPLEPPKLSNDQLTLAPSNLTSPQIPIEAVAPLSGTAHNRISRNRESALLKLRATRNRQAALLRLRARTRQISLPTPRRKAWAQNQSSLASSVSMSPFVRVPGVCDSKLPVVTAVWVKIWAMILNLFGGWMFRHHDGLSSESLWRIV
jgi:hypothetical protein